MDTRTKEFIAIGAAVTANCVPCLHYHVEKAQEAGDLLGPEEPHAHSGA